MTHSFPSRHSSVLMKPGGTCAPEHFTATLAHAILSAPAHLAGAETEAQRMWRWHAIEEIEHKAVAYDTLLLAMRDRTHFRRWTLRSRSEARRVGKDCVSKCRSRGWPFR